MRKVFTLGLISLLFCCPSASAESSLCPPLKPLPPEVDDLRVNESEFTHQHFENAFSFFREDLPKRFKEAKTTEELTDREGFWIGYDNSLSLIEGYVLKQAALLERAQLAGKQRGTRGPAVKRFCQFLTKTRSMD